MIELVRYVPVSQPGVTVTSPPPDPTPTVHKNRDPILSGKLSAVGKQWETFSSCFSLDAWKERAFFNVV